MGIRYYVMLSLALLTPVSALAAIVDVDAQWEYWKYNYSPIAFPPGTYQLSPIGIADGGKFDAWNAWGAGAVADCDASGLCSRGYLNSYSFGYIDTLGFVYEIATVGGSVVDGTAHAYETPSLALAHASSYVISLAEPSRLYFYVRDGETWYFDNSGGVSLRIDPIPEPNSASLLLAGILVIASLWRVGRPNKAIEATAKQRAFACCLVPSSLRSSTAAYCQQAKTRDGPRFSGFGPFIDRPGRCVTAPLPVSGVLVGKSRRKAGKSPPAPLAWRTVSFA